MVTFKFLAVVCVYLQVTSVFWMTNIPTCSAEIRDSKIDSDSRPMILFEKFGFTHHGHVQILVSDVTFKATQAAPDLDPSLMGFFLLTDEGLVQVLVELEQETHYCVLQSHFIKPLFSFKEQEASMSYNYSFPISDPNEYSLFFANCHHQYQVSMNVHTEMYNMEGDVKDFLPAGQTQLPKLYFCFFLLYLAFLGVWIYVCVKQRVTVHRIHVLMSALLLLKALNLVCEAEDKSYVKKYGTAHGWDIAFYIFGFFKGIMLFTLIVLIGTGWSFLKPYLQEREKKVLMIVIPLQVFANIASIVIDETGPSTKDWFTWQQAFLLIDIICCCVQPLDKLKREMEAPSACTSFSFTYNFKAGQRGRSRQLCVAPTPTRRCCHRAATNQGGADTGLAIRKPLPQFQNEEEEEKFQLDKEALPSTSKFVSPLEINLDLAIYRAKSLARNGLYDDARQILSKCIRDWPDDGRPYMTLGKLLMKQAKYVEARTVFENGCQATQGENPFIWQGWAVLERKMGNIKKARELFDAAITANKKHVAAWHGWACLEISEGNLNKGRDLLQKGIRYCGPNEYIFQTLALLEVKAKRYEKAQSLFLQATKCNPKSCASWLAWAQLEAEQENYIFARYLFEKAVQASPKNRFAWHIWALFEANQGEYDKARKLFRVGHALNPRDPVILQSLALFEYKCSSLTIAREIFKQAGQVDPRHQPIWIAWGWTEWKEGNIPTARELYQHALSIDSRSADAARCLQAWGILEEREGNIATARRLFKSSLNVDSQSFATWMSWAALEENQGNSIRAEEIRNLYFQQRTEVVGDASWDVDLSGFIVPAINRIKGLLTFDKGNEKPENSSFQQDEGDGVNNPDVINTSKKFLNNTKRGASFDLDSFLREKLSLDVSRVYSGSGPFFLKKNKNKSAWKWIKTKNTGTSSVT